MSTLITRHLPSIGQLANRYFAARNRYRTEMAIRALPFELQKDIGWPETDDERALVPASKSSCPIAGSENPLCFQ